MHGTTRLKQASCLHKHLHELKVSSLLMKMMHAHASMYDTQLCKHGRLRNGKVQHLCAVVSFLLRAFRGILFVAVYPDHTLWSIWG